MTGIAQALHVGLGILAACCEVHDVVSDGAGPDVAVCAVWIARKDTSAALYTSPPIDAGSLARAALPWFALGHARKSV